MKNLILAAIFMAISNLAFSQANFSVSGLVIDSTSKEPLASASVFCQNTTQGTATNKEGKFSMSLKPGGYDLIITFTGYKSITIPISQHTNTQDLVIEMVKEEKSMEEVVIRASAEVKDGWAKYGEFFVENFIGSTPFAKQCSLLNPEVLRFYYYRRSDKLKILADSPIYVRNYALGYNLRYTLDSFLFYYKTSMSSYRGFLFYEEMNSSEDTMQAWKLNRQKAYFGSVLHFMHSYFDSSLAQNHFVVAMLDPKDKTKFNRIIDLYDSTFFTHVDSMAEVDIYFPRKLSITYTRQVPETDYLLKYKLPLNIGVQTSYIDLLDVITIKQNGYYYDQRDWINSGYWSWKNIADQVPYDYVPD